MKSILNSFIITLFTLLLLWMILCFVLWEIPSLNHLDMSKWNEQQRFSLLIYIVGLTTIISYCKNFVKND